MEITDHADSDDDVWEYKSAKHRKCIANTDNASDVTGNVISANMREHGANIAARSHAHVVTRSKQTSKKRSQVRGSIATCSAKTLQKDQSDSVAGRCPCCQAPFSCIVLDTPDWHVLHCMSRQTASLPECPSGGCCDCSIASHYYRYKHSSLSALSAVTDMTMPTENYAITSQTELSIKCSQSLGGSVQPDLSSQSQAVSNQSDLSSQSQAVSNQSNLSSQSQDVPDCCSSPDLFAEQDLFERKQNTTTNFQQSQLIDGFADDDDELLISAADCMLQRAPYGVCTVNLCSRLAHDLDSARSVGAANLLDVKEDCCRQATLSMSNLNGNFDCNSAQTKPVAQMFAVQSRSSNKKLGKPAINGRQTSMDSFLNGQPTVAKRDHLNNNSPLVSAAEVPKHCTLPADPGTLRPIAAIFVQAAAKCQTSTNACSLHKDVQVPASKPISIKTTAGLPSGNPPGIVKATGRAWGGNGETKNRQCPFYKKIPGSSFTVDAFSYGTVPGCVAYFLSHFHSDHYMGLSKKFTHPLYCSQITANLVLKRLRVLPQFVNALSLNVAHVIDGVEVTLLEANHCPGSVMLLFKLHGGQVMLHTGDFRADSGMELYPQLQSVHVDQLYLDTTYCDESYTFPSQRDVINFAVLKAVQFCASHSSALVVVGTYTIGKERIFTAIAEALDCHICVTRDKLAVLECLDDPCLRRRLTLKARDARLHLLPMNEMNITSLQSYLDALRPGFQSLVAFCPTGWSHSNKTLSLDNIRPKSNKTAEIQLYDVPYSEHSSYTEMKRFVQFIRPVKILPTVNNGSAHSRAKMDTIFQSWLSGDVMGGVDVTIKQVVLDRWQQQKT